MRARTPRPSPGRPGLADGLTIEHLPAGPARPLAEDKLCRTWPRSAASSRSSGSAARRMSCMLISGPAASPHWPPLAAWNCRSCRRSTRWVPPTCATAAACRPARPPGYGSRPSSRAASRPSWQARRPRWPTSPAWASGAPRSGSCPSASTSRPSPPAGQAAERSDQRPRLLAVASQAQDHGLDTVIRALAHIPGAELLIVGGPPRAQLSSDPVLHGLAQLAERTGVSNRVLFTGQVGAARMPALLRSADLVVHVAMYEPFGLVPLEAMACGTPVVAAAGGSHQDAVVDGTTGILIPPGSPAALPGGSASSWPAPCCCRPTASPPRTGPAPGTPGSASAARPWPLTTAAGSSLPLRPASQSRRPFPSEPAKRGESRPGRAPSTVCAGPGTPRARHTRRPDRRSR